MSRLRRLALSDRYFFVTCNMRRLKRGEATGTVVVVQLQ
jgi:hypothetical protein